MVVSLNIRKSMSEYKRHSASAISKFIAAASYLARASSGPEILVLFSLCLVSQVSTTSTSDIGVVLAFGQICWDYRFLSVWLTQVLARSSMGNEWYIEDMVLILGF